MFRRSISQAITLHERDEEEESSDEEKKPRKLIRQATFDDKFKMNEKKIKADSGKLVDEEEVDAEKVSESILTHYYFKYMLP